ncbi:hypothetical protein pVco7_gp102 [Vibrio phage pVco-7]|uniref:Uncharacterized protein n=1 Tax=Vibrio phage pVco-5 TaxID=1965485 RepID=A0A1W6JV05_9CAUD|nr:hypothetical protein KNT61_gp102 [Vibrio phage pVco-5]ARM71090.1 hypothetical protein pVco5_102 [Vibrio phage pVco-5]
MTSHQQEKLTKATKAIVSAAATELGKLFIIGFIMIQLFTIVANFFGVGFDETDGNVRSNMALRIDAGTGCHYLESSDGYLIKRFNPDGTQYCEK